MKKKCKNQIKKGSFTNNSNNNKKGEQKKNAQSLLIFHHFLFQFIVIKPNRIKKNQLKCTFFL